MVLTGAIITFVFGFAFLGGAVGAAVAVVMMIRLRVHETGEMPDELTHPKELFKEVFNAPDDEPDAGPITNDVHHHWLHGDDEERRRG